MSAAFAPAAPARSAIRDVWPALVAIAPFAVAIGVAMQRTGLSLVGGLASGAMLFSGTAQLSGVTLLNNGATALAVVATIALINARLALYSAALQPHFRSQPTWFRWLGPQLIIDQSYVLVADRPPGDTRTFRRYWLTTGSCITTIWLGGQAAGMMLGDQLSRFPALTIVSPTIFVALLVPHVRTRDGQIVALAAGAGATAAIATTPAAGLVAGTAAGLLVGIWRDRP